MAKRSKHVTVFALVFLATSSLQAGVVPGRWEKVDALQPGFPIIVVLKSRDRVEGAFKSVGPDDLTVISQSGSERKFPKSGVSKIVSREKYDDSLSNGASIGAGIGAGLGAVPLIVSVVTGAVEGSLSLAIFIPMFAGIGAGLGVAIDALHKGTEVLYQAP